MSALLERLRTLHGECGDQNNAATAPVHLRFSLPEIPVPPAASEIARDWRAPQLREVERGGQSCLAGRTRLEPGTRHGGLAVGEVLNLTGPAAYILSGDERLRDFDVTRAAFFDLETTGLMGGSGNLAFLAGLVRVERSGHVVVHQVLLRHPAEEPAALELIQELLAPVEFLVSFNGKSFDRNVLADRFVMNRLEPGPILEMAHLDLLHPARRIYRGLLGACNLSAIELACLGVHRPATEVHGADVPDRWFRFLHSGRFSILQPVISHNLLDVLSLVTLGAKFATSLDLARLPSAPKTVQVAVARLLLLRGDAGEGEVVLRRITRGDPRESVVYSAMGLLAEHLRKNSRHVESTHLWARMIEAAGADDLAPWMGLVIALEHRLGRPGDALALVDRLLERMPRDGVSSPERRRLTHRRSRLARKAVVARSGPARAPAPERVDCDE